MMEPKNIEEIPNKDTMVQNIIDIVNKKTDTTIQEYMKIIDAGLKICDDEQKKINDKRNELMHIVNVVNTINKTIKGGQKWIIIKKKNIDKILDNIEYVKNGENVDEFKINLLSVGVKNIVNISDSVKELRLNGVDSMGQKKILCTKINVDTDNVIIYGYGTRCINC